MDRSRLGWGWTSHVSTLDGPSQLCVELSCHLEAIEGTSLLFPPLLAKSLRAMMTCCTVWVLDVSATVGRWGLTFIEHRLCALHCRVPLREALNY